MKNDELEIYFHVGLGKVASTYLQKKVFPNLKGIQYIPSTQYRKSKKILSDRSSGKFLVSREFDKQFEKEIDWFTTTYPKVNIIVLFRRHDSWLASQYRRFLKNGWYKDFDAFFNLYDTGYWKKEDLNFSRKIEYVIEKTGKFPLVILYDELKENPFDVFDQISNFTGTSYNASNISLKPVHKSYSDKQLRFLRFFTTKIFRTFPRDYNEVKWKHWLYFRPWWLLFHLIMYFALLLPDFLFSREPIISEETMENIRERFESDWRRVNGYADKSIEAYTPSSELRQLHPDGNPLHRDSGHYG